MTNALAKTPQSQLGSIDALRCELDPLGNPRNDSGGWTDEAKAISKALAPLGAKVAPTIADEQGKTWRMAMVMALSDLPPRIAIEAIGDAMHQPIRFLSEAEEVIRRMAGRKIRSIKLEMETEQQKQLNAQIEHSRIPTEETDAIIAEVWPSHSRRESKPSGGGLRIPNKSDVPAFENLLGRLGIKEQGK